MPLLTTSYNSTSNSTSDESVSNEQDFVIDCVPNFNGIEDLFYVFAFTRVIFFLVPMITGIFQKSDELNEKVNCKSLYLKTVNGRYNESIRSLRYHLC